MVLTKYENISKDDLIQELSGINLSFINDINAKLGGLLEHISKYINTCVAKMFKKPG